MFQNRITLIGFLGQDAEIRRTKGAHLQVEGDLRKRDYTEHTGGKESASTTKGVVEVRVTGIAKLDRPTRALESDPEPAEVPR